MDRRSILRFLGASAVAPSVGVKAAASALGVETAIVSGSAALPDVLPQEPGGNLWWRSPLSISFGAREDVDHWMRAGHLPYPHMKSWGHGFRSIVAQRDQTIMVLYRRKMEDDHDFRRSVFKALGLPGGEW